jgi:hypothetical protein
MSANLSSSLETLPGYTGHIEIDFEWNLNLNSTTHDHNTAARFSGALIGYLRTYDSTHNPIRSISMVCGHFVYFAHKVAEGYLILQLSRNESLAGVRRALYNLLGENDCPVVDQLIAPTGPILTRESSSIPSSGLSIWPNFRTELLKALSPIAPANIAMRLIDSAFTKMKIPVGSQPMNSQIYPLTLAILAEIPNPARRKVAEKDLLKLLALHQISPP